MANPRHGADELAGAEAWSPPGFIPAQAHLLILEQLAARDVELERAQAEAIRLRAELNRCSGCVTASDVGVPEYEPRVVHAHPKCPVHAQLAEAQADVAKLEPIAQRARDLAEMYPPSTFEHAIAREILGKEV